MALKTLIREELVRASLLVCPKKMAALSRRLLTSQLEEVDHQAQRLEQRRARLVELIAAIPHDSET